MGQNERLRELMTQFGISNRRLATEIHIDPAMISRWLKNGFGKRNVATNVLTVGEYIAGLRMSAADRSYLCARLGIPADSTITGEMIALWLAPEIENILPPPVNTVALPTLVESFHHIIAQSIEETRGQSDHTALSGAEGPVRLLETELDQIGENAAPLLFLTSESMNTAIDADLIRCLTRISEKKKLKWKMLLQSGNSHEKLGNLVSAYLPMIVQGYMQLSIMHGIPATMAGEMKIILPRQSVVMVTEVMDSRHSVLSTVSSDISVVDGMTANFENSLQYARPMLTVYDDSFAKNIVETFFNEYGVTGHLDVIKCGMNPMYFSLEHYGEVLRKLWPQDDQFEWRYREFARFQDGFANMMSTSRNREVLSLPKLREITRTGQCRMPAMYFLSPGIYTMSPRECVNLFDGYIRWLESAPDFQVVLTEDAQIFMPDSCWHIKNNRHIMLHSWNIDDPLMVYSEEMLLIDEFQRHFDLLWNKISIGNTKRSTIEQLKQLRDECALRL